MPRRLQGVDALKLLRRATTTALLTAAIHRPQCVQAATVEWDANPEPDILGYRVYYAEEIGPQFMIDAGNQTHVLLPDLSPGRRYRIQVTAYNDSGLESLPSS